MKRHLLPLLLILLFLFAPIALADHAGKVIQTMDSGGYTYVLLDTAQGKVWLAGPLTPIKVGERIECGQGLEMRKFTSASLKREFEQIWFVGGFGSDAEMKSSPHGGTGMGMALGMGNSPHGAGSASMGKASSVKKPAAGSIPKAGVTIEELYRQRAELKGQMIEVRGLVMKVSRQIMGKNWIHLSDGTGETGQDDLTITSQGAPKVGDLVVAKGQLNTDVDLGSGYFFTVLLEKAEFSTR